MQKNGAIKKKNKIIQVKNGFLEFDPEAYLSGADEFLKVFQEEAEKCTQESILAGGKPVKCEESLRKIMIAFDKLFGQGACEKVFGKDVVPTFDNFSEFLEKLEVLCKKWWR